MNMNNVFVYKDLTNDFIVILPRYTENSNMYYNEAANSWEKYAAVTRYENQLVALKVCSLIKRGHICPNDPNNPMPDNVNMIEIPFYRDDAGSRMCSYSLGEFWHNLDSLTEGEIISPQLLETIKCAFLCMIADVGLNLIIPVIRYARGIVKLVWQPGEDRLAATFHEIHPGQILFSDFENGTFWWEKWTPAYRFSPKFIERLKARGQS